MYVKNIYTILRPATISSLLCVLGCVLLSFTYCATSHASPAPGSIDSFCQFAGHGPLDIAEDPIVEKNNDDQQGHPKLFIRTRATLKSFIRCQFPAVEDKAMLPPTVASINQQYCGAVLVKPGYYTFLFRYTLF